MKVVLFILAFLPYLASAQRSVQPIAVLLPKPVISMKAVQSLHKGLYKAAIPAKHKAGMTRAKSSSRNQPNALLKNKFLYYKNMPYICGINQL